MGLILAILGFIVLVSGLAWLATLIGIAQAWVGGFALLMLALGAVFTIATMRERARQTAA